MLPHNMKENTNLDSIEGDEMFSFDARVKSFGRKTGKWFESGRSSKEQMAEVGLYVPDEEHRQRKTVKCAYCRHTFLDWTRNDDPHDRHSEESPDCLFMILAVPKGGENKLKIKEVLELQQFAMLQKLKEDYDKEKSLLHHRFDETRRNFLK
ncbi:hypothetical protein B566_EDAN004118 [Ephemera danica]|nr:hypothetical protein B566_EDAN004118 [Ephemera danica]